MFFKRLKNYIATLLALVAAGGSLFLVWGMRASRFPALSGERCFYLDTPSSQAGRKKELSLLDIARVRGESISLSLTETEAAALMEELGGEVLFVERVDGVCSYYGYTPAIYGGIVIGEYYVNLHIAVEGSRCVVGSPIIFGSF